MDTIKSFKGYGKVDPLEEQAFRRKTRKRLTILIISTVILLAVIGAVAGTLIRNRNSSSSSSSSTQTSPATSLKSVCSVTQYPDSCFSSIQALESSNTISDPQQIFKLSLQVVLNEITKISSFPQTLISRINDASIKSALTVCQTMIDDVKDRLNDSISSFDNKALSMQTINDLETWLSAVITDQETCFDALLELNNSAPVLNDVKSVMKNSTEFASNSLAIVAQILGILGNFNIPVHRKLLSTEFPDWFGAADRRLLQETSVEANLTVASDGSGNYKTINEAVAKVPRKSTERFVIYVKAGLYVENVNLDKNVRNVMMYGDGMDKTIISGSLNFVDGTPTFSTATFAVVGSGFIARDLAFKNTAGAEKHQAVALRSGSDMSVFYRCSIDAFQDTLYAHSNRQFYRECKITGTIDFIFGNSAVVFQNCNILPRQPMANQFVTITAQGKSDKNQNTGISIQKCTMSPLDDLTASAYLGRPWKNYATTVIMQTNIGSFLTPAGWYPWVSNVVPPKTIFYAEFQNTGPGSNVTNRVTWPGYKPSITPIQASKYTVKSFINGDDWLQNTNVMYDTSL